MGKPQQQNKHRSVVKAAASLGLEFDLQVDGGGHGQLVLAPAAGSALGNRRWYFVDNGALMQFLDGVRAGRELAAAEEARDAVGGEPGE